MYLKRTQYHNLRQILSLSGVLTLGIVAGVSFANMPAPTEHKDLDVVELGYVPTEYVSAQVGLEGHKLLLRKITINPGGQIAKHSHETTPGVVYVESGTWSEWRDSGVIQRAAGDTFVEDKDTVHWFYNHGAEPATAYVCDIKPS